MKNVNAPAPAPNNQTVVEIDVLPCTAIVDNVSSLAARAAI